MKIIPDVSVIILNYNRADLTFDCVRSVIKHTKNVHIEIIVVDNASTVGSIDAITNVSPVIRLIKSSINLGFSAGNNLGIEHSKGRSILLLNNDTLFIENSIETAYRALMQDSQIGVVGVRLLFPDGRLQHSVQRFPNIVHLLILLFRIQKLISSRKRARILQGGFFHCDEDIVTDWIWGTFFLIRRETLNNLPKGKLPADYFMYGEDLQWGIEIKRINYKIYFCSQTEIIHIAGASNGDLNLVSKNYYGVIKKYYGKWYLKIYQILSFLVRYSMLKLKA